LVMSSVNQNRVFLLDLGSVIQIFKGDCANSTERGKAGDLAKLLKARRRDIGIILDKPDDAFWKAVQGTLEMVPMIMTSQRKPSATKALSKPIDHEDVNLFRLNKESDIPKYQNIHKGRVYPKMLRSVDIYILDCSSHVCVWMGNATTPVQRQEAFTYALEHLKEIKRPNFIPMTRKIEGDVGNRQFDRVVFSEARKGWLGESMGYSETNSFWLAMEGAWNSMTESTRSCGGKRDGPEKDETKWNLADRRAFDSLPHTQATGVPIEHFGEEEELPLANTVEPPEKSTEPPQATEPTQPTPTQATESTQAVVVT